MIFSMAWNDLSVQQRSQLMNIYRKNGITSLPEMRRMYDLSSPFSPLVENTALNGKPVAPVYRKGGVKVSPQGVSEDDPAFVGPQITDNLRYGPPVPYGFYDKPIDYERLEAKQHYAESRFKNKQRSGPGARGPYQIMPKTWEAYTKKLGIIDADINNYNDNKRVKDALMKDLYNSSWATKGFPSDSVRNAKALAAYNWGSGNLTKHLNSLKQSGVDIYHSMDWIDTLPTETKNYVNFVLREKSGPSDLNMEAFEKALPNRFDAFPEVEYGKGGKIHIKPSQRGTFTAAAKKHGKSVQAFASQVLANKGNYSPAMVKKANFARNFGGHKHGDGGYLLGKIYDLSEEQIRELIQQGYEIERI